MKWLLWLWKRRKGLRPEPSSDLTPILTRAERAELERRLAVLRARHGVINGVHYIVTPSDGDQE